MKKFLVGLMLLALLAIVAGFALFKWQQNLMPAPLPTALAMPTATATDTPSATFTATDTSTPTATDTPTPTATPTLTPTLATRVLVITAVSPHVTLNPVIPAQPSSTPEALPTQSVPTPPAQMSPVPTGDAPQVGWFQYQVEDPAIQWQGQWELFTSSWHSINRHYYYSTDEKAALSLHFLGAGVRLRYVMYYTYGVFQVRLDDRVVATIDAYLPKLPQGGGDFVTTDVFGLANGWHTLEVHNLAQKNPASQGMLIAIDGIDVYLDGAAPTPTPTVPTTTPTFTPSPAPVQNLVQVIGPPTVQPTATQVAPQIASVSVLIAYDENNNKVADPDEGLKGISVRLVTVGTNQVIASGFTNTDGYVHLEALTSVPVRLVVPYFSKYWDVQNTRGGESRFTLILPPGNLPGLIP